MYRWVICATVIAALLTGACSWRRRCFPNEVTKLNCFAELPNAAFTSSSWMKWILPDNDEDSYLLTDDGHNDTEVLDTQEFAITKVEQDPQFFCDHKEKLIGALGCLAQAVLDKCPFMPTFVNYHYEKMTKSLGYLCSRMHEIDKLCLQQHWDVSRRCRHEYYHKQFRHSHHSHHSRHSRHSRHSHRKSSFRKSGNSTRSRKSSWSRHASTDWCQFHYNVNECARKIVKQCHGQTAEIMFEMGLNISSANCSARMAAWAAARVGDDVTDCDDGHCDAASLPPVALWTLLIAVSLAVQIQTLWK